MKKILFFLVFLICIGNVLALPHYFVVDSDSTSADIAMREEIIDDVIGNEKYEKINDGKVDIDVLDNRVTAILYQGNAALIVGVNSPVEQVILAGEIGAYLNSENYDVLPALLSNEVKFDDLTLLFKDCSDCEACGTCEVEAESVEKSVSEEKVVDSDVAAALEVKNVQTDKSVESSSEKDKVKADETPVPELYEEPKIEMNIIQKIIEWLKKLFS